MSVSVILAHLTDAELAELLQSARVESARRRRVSRRVGATECRYCGQAPSEGNMICDDCIRNSINRQKLRERAPLTMSEAARLREARKRGAA